MKKFKKIKNLLVMFCAGQNRSTEKCYEIFIAKYLKILITKFKFEKKICIFYPIKTISKR